MFFKRFFYRKRRDPSREISASRMIWKGLEIIRVLPQRSDGFNVITARICEPAYDYVGSTLEIKQSRYVVRGVEYGSSDLLVGLICELVCKHR